MSILPRPPRSGIYSITHISTGRQYVGSAVYLVGRWRNHRHGLNAGVHHAPWLQNAWAEYGEAAFRFAVLETVQDKGELLVREQFWIDTLSPVFNTCSVAGNCLGVKHSEETRRRMSEAAQKRCQAEGAKEKLSRAAKGIKHTEAFCEAKRTRLKELWEDAAYRERITEIRRATAKDPAFIAKIAAASKANSQTPEGRAQRVNAGKGKKRSPEQRARYSEAAKARWAKHHAAG